MERKVKKAIKFSFNLRLLFHQVTDEAHITEPPVEINTKTHEFVAADNIQELINSSFDELCKRIETFQAKGSGWVLHKLLKLILKVDHFDPLRASSYIPTPHYIAAKRAVLNVQNQDNACFIWSYLSASGMLFAPMPL